MIDARKCYYLESPLPLLRLPQTHTPPDPPPGGSENKEETPPYNPKFHNCLWSGGVAGATAPTTGLEGFWSFYRGSKFDSPDSVASIGLSERFVLGYPSTFVLPIGWCISFMVFQQEMTLQVLVFEERMGVNMCRQSPHNTTHTSPT